MSRPTLHVTNWASHQKLHGPGMAYTMMAASRRWEKGAGRAVQLTPSLSWLRDVQAGKLSIDDYRELYTEHLKLHDLGPGDLRASTWVMRQNLYLRDGDTLCCACARAAAARGECHRVWAAEALVKAGWRVILDGKELQP